MIDASPGTGPNDIHDYVPEDDVSIIFLIFHNHDSLPPVKPVLPVLPL
jgi:hypothetical protein